MNLAAKGALLSGLVFPGLGQIVQKHYGRGIALVGFVSASLLVIVATVVREVQGVLDKVAAGTVAFDVGTILAEAERASGGHGATAMTVATVAIVCCWAIGIVDAYVVGKRMESGRSSEGTRSGGLPLAGLILSSLCLVAATSSQAQPTEGLIDTERLHAMVVDNAYKLEGGRPPQYVIIDTRPADRYAEACIFSAINIPKQAFVIASPPLPEDRGATIVLYGDEGDREPNAGDRARLMQAGYAKVFVYSEPFSVWKEGRLPVVQARRPLAGDPRGGGPCREGTFATENHSSSYDVFFTNTSGEACDTVSAYCLCSVSFGAYRQSRDIAVSGSFAAGATARIATIEVTGPATRDIDWSWCKLR